MNDAHRDPWPPVWLGVLAWPGIIACAGLFTVLAVLAGTIGTLPGDRWVSHAVQRLHGEPWRVLWHVGNAFGTSRWVAVLALLMLIGMLVLRRWQDAWFLGLAIILRVAAMPLKSVVGSPRPTAAQVRIVEPVAGYGFPSGHTLTAMVLFGVIAVLLVRHVSHPRIRPLATALWIGGVGLTGFARIWGGAHWPSDVLGGALAGIVIVGVAAQLSRTFVPSTGPATETTVS